MYGLYTETLEKLLKNKKYGEVSEDTSLTEVIVLMNKFPKFVFNSPLVSFEFDMLNLFIHCYDLREIGSETEELFIHYWRETTERLLVKFSPKIQMWLDNFNDLFKFTVKLSRENLIGMTTQKEGNKSRSRTENENETNEILKNENTNVSKDYSSDKSENISKDRETEKAGSQNSSSSENTNNKNENTYYLNPANASSTNLKIQDVDKSDNDIKTDKENISENSESATDKSTEVKSNSGTEKVEEESSKANTESSEKANAKSANETENNSENTNRDINSLETKDVLQSVWGKTRANLLQQIMDLQDIYLDCLYEFEVLFMGVY